MQSFFRQRSVRSKHNRRVRVSANSMSFEDFFSSLKEATGQDYQRSDVEELFNEAGALPFVVIYFFISSGATEKTNVYAGRFTNRVVWTRLGPALFLLLYRWTSLVMVVSDGKHSTTSFCSITSISKTRCGPVKIYPSHSLQYNTVPTTR